MEFAFELIDTLRVHSDKPPDFIKAKLVQCIQELKKLAAEPVTVDSANAIAILLTFVTHFGGITEETCEHIIAELLTIIKKLSNGLTESPPLIGMDVASPCIGVCLSSLGICLCKAKMSTDELTTVIRSVWQSTEPFFSMKDPLTGQLPHLDEPWLAEGIAHFLWHALSLNHVDILAVCCEAAPILQGISTLTPICIDSSGTSTLPIHVLWLVFQYATTLLDYFDADTVAAIPPKPSTKEMQSLTLNTNSSALLTCWKAIEKSLLSVERLFNSVRNDVKESAIMLQAFTIVSSRTLPKPISRPEKRASDEIIQGVIDALVNVTDECLETLLTLLRKRRMWLMKTFFSFQVPPLVKLFWSCCTSGNKPLVQQMLRRLPCEYVEHVLMQTADEFDLHSQAVHKLVRRERNIPLLKYLLEEEDPVLDSIVGRKNANHLVGPRIMTVQMGDMYPLHIASIRNNPNVVRILVNAGASLESMDENKKTALYWSCACGGYDAVRVLLELGADPNACDESGFTPLHRASVLPDARIVEALLTNGANPNLLTKSSKASALHRAIYKGLTENVRLILEHGGDVNIVDGDGDSCLRLAVLANNNELVQMLIKMGADVNVQNIRGLTALHTAKNPEVVQILLNAGADLERTSFNIKETPLISACSEGRVDVVRELIKFGANLEARTIKMSTPLCVAAMWGHDEVVRVLLENGACVNACNAKGYAAIHWAIKQLNKTIFDILVQHPELNFSAVTEHSLNYLHLACSAVNVYRDGGNVKKVAEPNDKLMSIILKDKESRLEESLNTVKYMMQVLIDKGVDVNGRSLYGRLPLHLCVERLPVDHVQLLLQHGSQIDVVALGKTPLAIAATIGAEDVALALIERGASLGHTFHNNSILLISTKQRLRKVVNAIILVNTQNFEIFSRDQVIKEGLLPALEQRDVDIALAYAEYLRTIVTDASTKLDVALRVLELSTNVESLLLEGVSTSNFASGSPDSTLSIEDLPSLFLQWLTQAVLMNKHSLRDIVATLMTDIDELPKENILQLCHALETNYDLHSIKIYSSPTLDANAIRSNFYSRKLTGLNTVATDLLANHVLVQSCLYRNRQLATNHLAGFYMSMVQLLLSADRTGDVIVTNNSICRRIHSFMLRAWKIPWLSHSKESTLQLSLSDSALNYLVWFLYSDELCPQISMHPAFHQTFFPDHNKKCSMVDHLVLEINEIHTIALDLNWLELAHTLESIVDDALQNEDPFQVDSKLHHTKYLQSRLQNHPRIRHTLPRLLGQLLEDAQIQPNSSCSDFVIKAAEVDTSRLNDSEDYKLKYVDLHVHKQLLMVRWPWFCQMMASGFRESSTDVLDLTSAAMDIGITAEFLRNLLHYIYTGDTKEFGSSELDELVDYFGFRENQLSEQIHRHLISAWSAETKQL